MDPISLHLRLLPGHYAVARPDTWPDWLPVAGFVSVTRTAGEISVVCEESLVPEGVLKESGFRAWEFQGPFPFGLTGILHSVLHPLAQARIGIFAISTYDTDYVLVKAEDLEKSIAILREYGHVLEGAPPPGSS